MLRDHEWIEGDNFALEGRWAAGKTERLPELAAELVRLNTAVIVAWSTPAVIAAKRATSTIPIVMASSGDAVETGLIASLARPGGNVTGLSILGTEYTRKHPELLRDVLPGVSHIGVLFDPTSPAEVLGRREIHTTAKTLGLRDESLPARNLTEIESAFAEVRKQGVQALIVSPGGVNWANRKRLFELAAVGRIPAVYATSEFSKEGGLMSYGVDFLDLTRRAADYVDKILKSAKPSELPVEQPTKFELVINLKTAKALGLTIPPSLLLRADQIIE